MTTYIVHDAITGHPIGLASQSLLQAHLKLKEAVPGSVPTFIAASNRVCGGIEVYELNESGGAQQWPRLRAVQLMELPEPNYDIGPYGANGLPEGWAMESWVPSKSADEAPSIPAPWSWPTLPPGHSYLNPENLSVAQLGDGWRPLCTLDESFPEDHEMHGSSGWTLACPCRGRPDDSFNLTYRTRAPIPTLTSNP